MLKSMGSIAAGLPQSTLNVLEGQTFFPNAIASPFMTALTTAFIFAAVLCFLAALFSGLRGKKTVCVKNEEVETKSGIEPSKEA
jgi:hypothetical protein